MRDKTDQIIKAAIKVFVDKGFLQATTQEIAKEANVAEVTLYRKFSTKQNLFQFVIKKVLEDKFQIKLFELVHEKNTEIFFKSILNDRLTIISKNEMLVKLLISESIMGNLPNEINFINLIFKSLKNAIQTHFDHLNKGIDADFYARQLGSILLGYALLPPAKPFHKLNPDEREKLIIKYIHSLFANL